jgi:BTB/POZ domain-containing protein KCTD9
MTGHNFDPPKAVLRETFSIINVMGEELTIGPGVNLQGKNLSALNLAGANLEEANLSGANISKANLTGANLRGANLNDVMAFEAVLCDVEASLMTAKSADMTRIDATGGNFEGGNFNNANFFDANLTKTSFHGSLMKNVSLISCKMYKANFSLCILTEADFTGANMGELLLDETQCQRSKWFAVDAQQMQAVSVDLSGSVFTNSNLAGSKMSDSNLTECVINGGDWLLIMAENTNWTQAQFLPEKCSGIGLPKPLEGNTTNRLGGGDR